MRQSVSTRLMLALVLTLTLAMAVATQAAPVAQEADPAQAAGNPARVSIVHAAPFDLDGPGGNAYSREGTAVTVTATSGSETALLAQGIVFSGSTPYLSLPAGSYDVKVFAGTRSLEQTLSLTPALSATVSLSANRDYTVVAVGLANATYPLDLRVFEDTPAGAGPTQGEVRLIHAAPFAPTAAQTDVRVVDTAPTPDVTLVPTLTYSDTTDFIALAAGLYAPTVIANIGGTTILPPTPLPLAPGQRTTLIAAGDGVNEQPRVIAQNFAARSDSQVRFVHAAPFATGSATASLLIDPDFVAGNDIRLEGLDFTDKTLYREVDPGIYTVKVYAGAVISGTPVLTESLQILDGQTLTAVVVGTGATPYDLDIQVLVDRRTPASSATADVRFFHAAPFAPLIAGTGVDIVAQDGSPLSPPVSNLRYGEVTDYITLPSGVPIDTRVVLAGTGTTVIDVPALTLGAGTVQTVIAVGGANGQQPGLIVLNDLQTTTTMYLPLVWQNPIP